MAEPRHAPLSFRPAPRVARDEQFDETLFDRAAGAKSAPLDEDSEPGERPVREGLPRSYRMRADPHYVDQLASRRHAEPVHLLPVGQIDGPHPVETVRDLEPLIESIATVGVLQPLLVRRQNGRYLLIAGARRLAAAIAAGLAEVPCLLHVADEERAKALAAAEAVVSAPRDTAPRAADTRIPAGVFGDITEHLGGIRACLHLFGDRDRPLRERVALGLIDAEVQRAVWLSQALAVLASDPAVACNAVEINGLVQRLLATLTPERVLAGVEFEFEAQASPCLARGDEQLLAVAVAGLVGAVHALVERVHDARVTVRVSACGDEVCVEVSQANVTLPPAWQPRFFDVSWSERPGGASIGASLAAARRVAALHGGDVQLAATDRGGCTLRLTIPAVRR